MTAIRIARSRSNQPARHGDPWRIALIGLVLAALALRFIGLNWDDGQLLHPDEYHVTEVTVDRVQLPLPLDWSNLTDPSVSTLNPRSDGPDEMHRSFAYGSLPLYATDLAAEVLNRLGGILIIAALIPGDADRDWHAIDQVFKVGRTINMVLDSIVVGLVFLLARRIGGVVAGLTGAAIYAFAPMTIQLAHFYTTDTWLTFGAILTLLACATAARRGDRRLFLLAGLAAGFTVATKPTGAAAVALIGVAVAYDAWVRHRSGVSPVQVLSAAIERLVIAIMAALVIFAVCEPYAILDPSSYLADLREQTSIQRGTFDVPYTRIYVGTTPVFYQADQLIRWGMGPVGGFFGIAGIAALVWRAFRHRGSAELITLGWIVIFLCTLLLPQSKFLRYVAPMVPALAIAGGYLLSLLSTAVLRRAGRTAAVAVPAAAMAALVFWVSATSSVYAADNTRVAATRWIYDNVPPGSAITTEVWDRGVPLDMGPVLRAETLQYEWVAFDSYTDRANYRDAALIADALAALPLTAPVADAIRADDLNLAGQLLLDVEPQLVGLADAEREALHTGMSDARTSLTLGSELQGPLDRIADSLGVPPLGDPAAAWIDLAVELPAFGERETATVIYRQLEQADYYIISSDRITASLPQLPWRYPVQNAFFAALEDGRLGFNLVAEFTSRPTTMGITFDDDAADETWINYDHPRVLVYQQTDLIPQAEFNDLLADARLQPTTPTRDAPADDLLLDEPNADLPVVADARWSSVLTDNSAAALAVWVVLLVLLQLIGLPLARLLLGHSADGGWVFARLLALLLAAFVIWLGASTGLWLFRAVWCGLALLVIAAVGWGLRTRWRSGQRLFSVTTSQRRLAGYGEIVFWATFAFFLVLRFLNPDSWHTHWGGEKPMEFAHINATLRSGEFPPYDPWYSGGYLNYYYYGLYVVAFMIKVTGIPSEIAFNLAQPTVFAFLGAGAFGVAATLGRDLTRRLATRGQAPLIAGLLGTVLMVVLGNPAGFFNVINAQYADNAWLNYVWGPSRAFGNENVITEFPYFTALYADLHAHVVALPFTVLIVALCYSVASSARPLQLALAGGARARPWRVAVGARLVVLGILVGTLYMTNAWDIATYALFALGAIWLATRALPGLVARLVATAFLAVGVGIVAFVSVLPFYLKFVALFGEIGTVDEPDPFWSVMRHFGGLTVVLVIGMTALLATTAQGQWRTWLQPLLPVAVVATLLALGAIGSGPTIPDNEAFSLRDLAILGIVVVVAILLGAAGWSRRTSYRDPVAITLARQVVIVVVALVAVGAAAIGQQVFGLGVAIAGAGAMAFLFVPGTGPRMVGLMVAAAGGIIAALEVVYLVDNLDGGPAYRMNTIFKFYNQVWVLAAMAGGALAARMIALAWDSLRQPEPVEHASAAGEPVAGFHSESGPDGPSGRPVLAPVALPDLPSIGWSRVGVIALAIVIGVGLCYPLSATAVRVNMRFDGTPNTLDSLAWMDYATMSDRYGGCADLDGAPGGISFADDHAAIEWFNEEVDGTPVIAEASIDQYLCYGSRFSIMTGLPTILGWQYHESQQRYADGLEQRERDVRVLYSSTEPATKELLIRQYGVGYVVVGALERGIMIGGRNYWADPAGLAAFDQMVGTTLEVAFQSGDTIVYRVLPATAT